MNWGTRVLSTLFIGVFLSIPIVASAATNVSQTIVPFGVGVGAGLLLSEALKNSANDTCKGCQNIDATKPNYCARIQCSTTSSGYTVTGYCGSPGQCRGTSAQTLGGGSMNLGTILQVVGLVATLAQLSQQQKNAGVPAGGAPYYGGGCTTYYSVTTPTGDPCAIYNPTPVSGTIAEKPISDFGTGGSISDALLNSLNRPEQSGSVSVGNAGSRLEEIAFGNSSTTNASGTKAVAINEDLASSVVTSSVREGNAGATIIANLREGFTEVAGFFGSTFSGGKQQSVASRLCTNRPWAAGFLVKLFSPALFDAICSKLGYQVGPVEEVGPAFERHQIMPGDGGATPRIETLVPPAEVDIWAEPASVRLNTRAKIFWSSRNADSCTIMGPSFEQSSLSGGGATVPIAGPTTFTITCKNGKNTVSDSVTVNLAI